MADKKKPEAVKVAKDGTPLEGGKATVSAGSITPAPTTAKPHVKGVDVDLEVLDGKAKK